MSLTKTNPIPNTHGRDTKLFRIKTRFLGKDLDDEEITLKYITATETNHVYDHINKKYHGKNGLTPQK